MKSLNKKRLLKLGAWILFFVLFIGTSIVYAKTSAEIAFCDYASVRRTFMIIGILLNLVKVVVPLIIIFVAIVAFFKIVMSGKTEDLKSSLMQVVKNGIAGLIIFILPGVVNFAIESLVEYDDTGFTKCTTCLLDTDHCEIPDEDPDTYEED